MDIAIHRTKLEQLKGAQFKLTTDLEKAIADKAVLEKKKRFNDLALEIVKQVGMKTQQQLQFHISEITTLALQTVFPNNPYSLQVEFVERRNQTECDLYFMRDGDLIDPTSASGGGAVEVAAFALRIASWSMSHPRTDNVILLDEPMHFLSEDLREQASLLLKQISEKLNIQFIIVTHLPQLAKHADRVFRITNRRGRSKVTIINNQEEL